MNPWLIPGSSPVRKSALTWKEAAVSFLKVTGLFLGVRQA